MNRIKELRLSLNLTQSALALMLGVNQTAVGKYERGDLEPGIQILKQLSSIFECSIDYIVSNSDDFGVINMPVREKSTDVLSTDERKLIETYRKLNSKNQMHVGVYATLRLEEQEETKKTVKALIDKYNIISDFDIYSKQETSCSKSHKAYHLICLFMRSSNTFFNHNSSDKWSK